MGEIFERPSAPARHRLDVDAYYRMAETGLAQRELQRPVGMGRRPSARTRASDGEACGLSQCPYSPLPDSVIPVTPVSVSGR